MEKPLGASTCTLINQKCVGHSGTFTPNPKKKSKYNTYNSISVNVNFLKTENCVDPIVIDTYETPKKTSNDPI
jgi:hypothetical protein